MIICWPRKKLNRPRFDWKNVWNYKKKTTLWFEKIYFSVTQDGEIKSESTLPENKRFNPENRLGSCDHETLQDLFSKENFPETRANKALHFLRSIMLNLMARLY